MTCYIFFINVFLRKVFKCVDIFPDFSPPRWLFKRPLEEPKPFVNIDGPLRLRQGGHHSLVQRQFLEIHDGPPDAGRGNSKFL